MRCHAYICMDFAYVECTVICKKISKKQQLKTRVRVHWHAPTIQGHWRRNLIWRSIVVAQFLHTARATTNSPSQLLSVSHAPFDIDVRVRVRECACVCVRAKAWTKRQLNLYYNKMRFVDHKPRTSPRNLTIRDTLPH
jgi:hypothetical protein